MATELDKLLQSYEIFLSELLGYEKEIMKNYYVDASNKMCNDFQESDFIKAINDNLNEYNQEYISENNFKLLDENKKVKIITKKYKNMLEKCFRKDVLQKEGALEILQSDDYDNLVKYVEYTPINCYWKFTDVIRTRITVNYMDGALDILEKLEELAKVKGLTPYKNYKASDDGYYALHLDVETDFEIPDVLRKTKNIKAKVEIQINTAVQNLLVDLSHEYYQKTRSNLKIQDIKWQWVHDSDNFIPNYIGHIAHYVEGMMLNIRDKTYL